MNGFFVTISPERLKRTSPLRVKQLLGVMTDDFFVQPPRCEKCGGPIELGEDWQEGLVSCNECGNQARIYKYDQCPIKI